MIFGALNEDILRVSKEEHPSNIPFISVIFCALNEDKSSDVKEEHPFPTFLSNPNIFAIFVTFIVLNESKFTDVNELHPLNISLRSVNFSVLISVNTINKELLFLLIPYLPYSSYPIYSHMSYFFSLISNLQFSLFFSTNSPPKTLIFSSPLILYIIVILIIPSLNEDKSREVKEEQRLNINLISTTFCVLNEDKSSEVKDSQPLNILSMLVTF